MCSLHTYIFACSFFLQGLKKENEDVDDSSNIVKIDTSVRDLLELARTQKLIDVYFGDVSLGVFKLFFQEVLPHVVQKRKWRSCSHMQQLSTFVHESDEAFAMLVLENNCELWADIVDFPHKSKRERVKQRYVHPTRGWTLEGEIRYTNLLLELKAGKEKNVEDYSRLQDKVLELERALNDSSSRKRRKVADMVTEDQYEFDRRKQLLALRSQLNGISGGESSNTSGSVSKGDTLGTLLPRVQEGGVGQDVSGGRNNAVSLNM